MSTVQLRTRVDRTLKKKSDAVLRRLGLDAGSYVSMALAQLVYKRAIPFAVAEPAADYVASDYKLTAAQRAAAGAALRREAARARRRGELREISGAGDLTP